MPENSSFSYIGFRTNLMWSAGDVVTLFTSVSGLYNTFLALHIYDKQQSLYREVMEHYLHDYMMLFERYLRGPFDKEFFLIYERLLKIWKRQGFKYPPPLPFPFGFPSGVQPQAPSVWELYENIERYTIESDMLQVDRIRMASPGGISVKLGIDKVLKETREFIKDIWYRNKQEKARGRLRLIEEYFTIRRKFPEADLPPFPTAPTERKLIKTVDDHFEKLHQLEQKGKLLDVAEHIDYRPPPSKEG